jgi:uncharacterized membrane protein YtjA (UPF0391 family)
LLIYALILLTLALLFGVLGFGVVAGMAAAVLKFLLFACIVLAVVSTPVRRM